MLKRVVRLLEENLTYEKAHLGIEGEREWSEDMINQIEQTIAILKIDILGRLHEATNGYRNELNTVSQWADIGVDLLFDINLLISDIENNG